MSGNQSLTSLELRSIGQEVNEVALAFNASSHQGDRRKTSQMCILACISALAINAHTHSAFAMFLSMFILLVYVLSMFVEASLQP